MLNISCNILLRAFWTWISDQKYLVSGNLYIRSEKRGLVEKPHSPNPGGCPTSFIANNSQRITSDPIFADDHLSPGPTFAKRPTFLPTEQICPDFLLSTVFAQTHNWPAG